MGSGEEKRRLKDTFIMVCFFAGRREFPNFPFYVVYNILISGGFTVPSSDHREGDPGP